MKTIRIFLLAAVVCFAAALSPVFSPSPAYAGPIMVGRFCYILKNSICQDMSAPAGVGCFFYIVYRVETHKDRDGAKNACYQEACQKYKYNPAQLSNCQEGCDHAYIAEITR